MENSTFVLERIEEERREFHSKAKESREKPEVKALMDELKSIETFSEFRSYMHKIISKRLPSPLYSFIDEEDNTDNHWWKDGNKKYELLKQINEYVVTVNAQEDGGITQIYSEELKRMDKRRVMFECPLLTFLFPKSKVQLLKDGIQKLKDNHYNYRFAITDQNASNEERIPVRTYITFDSKNDIIDVEYDAFVMQTTSENTFSYSVNDFFEENKDYFSDELFSILTNDFVYCDIMDMNFISPEKKHGLFSNLLKLFNTLNMKA